MSTAAQHSWPEVLGALISGDDLTADAAGWAMDQVMSGVATPAQIAGFVVGLRAKGETSVEISGMAETMLAHAERVHIDGDAIDIVGTGGDQAGTVNISTMAALVTAAAGIPVVKHGARAASSQSGTGDVLEALGVAIELPPEAIRRCVAELGIGFCFAPRYHPALRHAASTRRELGVPTAFNVLGPLANPAQPRFGLIGCAHQRLAPVMAGAFAARGARILLVRGDDGLDEITTTTTTTVWVVQDGQVRVDSIDPAALGIPLATPGQLRGGSPAVNAQVVRDLLAGRISPVRDAVLLNTAAAIAVYRGLSGDLHADLHADLRQGLDTATEAIDSGAGATLLDRWIELSRSL